MGEELRTAPYCDQIGAHVGAGPTAHCIYCGEHTAPMSEANCRECLLRAAGVTNWQNR